jgi:glycosyltransferase involved in cell wall biosynthesis
MKIGIEIRQATLGHAGGIALLLKGLLETLFQRHPEHRYVVYTTVFNRALLDGAPAEVQFRTLPIRNYTTELDRLAAEEGLDVLFRGYPMEPPLAFPLRQQLFLIPDIQHESLPEFFGAEVLRTRRRAFTEALAGAGAIGTISEFARRTLREQRCTRCRDIFLVSPALQREHRRASADLTPGEQALVPERDFFLYPANLWPHKNHRRVLQAFAAFLGQTGRQVEFVCTGHPDGWEKIQADFPSLPVRHLGFVSAALLRCLMRRARALAFFSLYEGFGMPLLEAFDAGTPVVCSNTTSLPEVGGDAVLSCDPADPAAMAALMARVVADDGLRDELVARGERRLGAYSWERSADNLLAACERVARLSCSWDPSLPLLREGEQWPLVSIVTPSYNQGRFLRRTVESILRQSYPHIDYCVMDGGSTDESVAILKSYGNRFPWVSEPDRGQTHAINKGFARARGEIRAYLNSDDVLLPDAVAKAVAHFLRRPECDLVYGRADYIDEHDQVTGTYNTAEYSFPRLMMDCCICQPAAFWRRRIADKIGPFDERLNYVMDYDYWLRIDRAGGCLEHIHDKLACSRRYPETKTLSGRYKIYREIFRVCKQHGGYVDIGFCHGFWHHLCWERAGSLPSRLRWLPRFQTGMAHLHHKWLNRDRYTVGRVLTGVGRRLGRLAGVGLGPFAALLGRMERWSKLLTRRKWVRGFWDDNWLAPTCRVVLKDRGRDGWLRLAGTAPRDMTLTVRAGRRIVGAFPLRADRYETVCFPVQAELGHRLTLHFSDQVVDASGRVVSFLLQDTNLFSEQDLG